jgi:AraC-like DNA-binding protein
MSNSTHVDDWQEDLHGICGHYYGVAKPGQRTVNGRVGTHKFDTLDVASVTGDVHSIKRSHEGIRRDDSEHIFCLFQMSGQLNVRHNNNRVILKPCESLLLDSTKEAELYFSESACHLISLHMPRSTFLAANRNEVQIGHKMRAAHPMAASILQQIKEYALNETQSVAVSRASSDMLLSMIQIGFSNVDNVDRNYHPGVNEDRFQFAIQLIESHLTEEELSLDWLADRMRISRRQVQRVFQEGNDSFAKAVRSRRLKLVAEKLSTSRAHSRPARISEVAYSVGFRDLSNFNRGFKEQFGYCPRDHFTSGPDAGRA